MDEHLNCDPPPVTGGDLPSRKRGRPPIPVSPEVLEGRIMSRQRANAFRPKAKDGDLSTRKRGRPPITLTEEILERRRMSRQRVNASRPKRNYKWVIQTHYSAQVIVSFYNPFLLLGKKG